MFIPRLVLIEEKALDYTKGKEWETHFRSAKIPIRYMKTPRVRLMGDSPYEKYLDGKNTLIVGVRKSSQFQSCKPSAHFQLPLVSGCMGMCEYCYLNTQMGKRPYVKIYANAQEILAKADRYMKDRAPDTTIFEGAATSDPLALEPYSHLLSDAILHFANTPHGRFRFVSKFTDIEPLLPLRHNNHTEIRISVNIERAIRQYEHRTPSLDKRLEAAKKLSDAGYPTGVIIAPVFWSPENQEDYRSLIRRLGETFADRAITVELISHRFTAAAKNNILEIFPETKLPMNEKDRTFKFGQFGYGKYVYPKETLEAYKRFFEQELQRRIPNAKILYMI